ncbi:lysoplasmalogenase family protein [Robiginitomaculum antarcticum]|uniref:lysoplasmalogenase family protein n=1 Tax=Robiginitomaculum antarcticum TaxID=437507 RepID=UPI00036DAC8C|nr:lysoplasmalogenase family protein [Robiginitomaculum antarcticum]
MMSIVLSLYALCVFALLMAELRGQMTAQYISKTLAGLGFLSIAVLSGAMDSIYGQLILAALVFSFIGDLCLLQRGTGRAFLAGMAAFAAAHIVYIFALAQWGFEPWWLWTFLPAVLIGLAAYIIMKTDIPGKLQAGTLLYSVVIALMGAFAILATRSSGHGLFVIAAACFILSDIFVSRHRFKPVAKQTLLAGPRNYLVITPFYFFAQVLFALSVGLAV